MARLTRSAETAQRSFISICPNSLLLRPHTLLKVLHVGACQRDADLVDFGGGDGRAGRIVFLFTLSDVTHPVFFGRLSQKVTAVPNNIT